MTSRPFCVAPDVPMYGTVNRGPRCTVQYTGTKTLATVLAVEGRPAVTHHTPERVEAKDPNAHGAVQ